MAVQLSGLVPTLEALVWTRQMASRGLARVKHQHDRH